MSDEFIDRLIENEKILKGMTDEQAVMLSLSEVLYESALGDDVPPGTKAKRISLSADLYRRAGVRF